MKDMLGRELKENDLVIVQVPRYADLMVAKVVGFTAKKVRVQWNEKQKEPDTKLFDPWYVYRMHDEDAIKYRLTKVTV